MTEVHSADVLRCKMPPWTPNTQGDVRLPQTGELWAHYREGIQYLILCIAFDADSAEPVVVYQSFDRGQVTNWTRPLGNFLGFADDRCRRFTLIG